MLFDVYAKEEGLNISINEMFKNKTTIGCGGLIKYTYYPKNIEELRKVFKFINENKMRYFILGNGSNVLARDELFDGVVIDMKSLESYIYYFDDKITVSSSYLTSSLANRLALDELGNLAFLIGIPGTVGGAIYNNSGAFNDAIGNHVMSVKIINKDGLIKVLDSSLCAFSYRKSIFHYLGAIIVEADIKVMKMKTDNLIKEYKEKRLNSQPLGTKNMGSIFKNNPLIESWRVVDYLGLRGFYIGDAYVSDKHSNFIINHSNAKASDVICLIKLIETRAKLELGITLISEITIV